MLLSHLWSLPSSSPARERLVQYIQNSATPVILDCLFQHIPVDLCNSQSLKKKDTELPAGLSEAAIAATRSITTGSLLFSIKTLWPVEPVKLASHAGALFGFMLCVLPAYVREWFSGLRDRSISSLIESFTRAWCSPPLIANELSQVCIVGQQICFWHVRNDANTLMHPHAWINTFISLKIPGLYGLIRRL